MLRRPSSLCIADVAWWTSVQHCRAGQATAGLGKLITWREQHGVLLLPACIGRRVQQGSGRGGAVLWCSYGEEQETLEGMMLLWQRLRAEAQRNAGTAAMRLLDDALCILEPDSPVPFTMRKQVRQSCAHLQRYPSLHGCDACWAVDARRAAMPLVGLELSKVVAPLSPKFIPQALSLKWWHVR
jgi:hypothetical protein